MNKMTLIEIMIWEVVGGAEPKSDHLKPSTIPVVGFIN